MGGGSKGGGGAGSAHTEKNVFVVCVLSTSCFFRIKLFYGQCCREQVGWNGKLHIFEIFRFFFTKSLISLHRVDKNPFCFLQTCSPNSFPQPTSIRLAAKIFYFLTEQEL